MHGTRFPLTTNPDFPSYDSLGRPCPLLEPVAPNHAPCLGVSPDSSDFHDSDDVGEMDREDLLRSFDLLFQLHQRAEDVRNHIEAIDHLLLNSRTVAGLAREVARSLAQNLDLAAVRLLFRREHELHAPLLWDPPEGVGFLPSGFLENEGPTDTGPFILEDASGELAFQLFGNAAFTVCSAAVAPLCLDGREFGLLCLGSDDPLRYCGGMNTDVIASLAAKISLGLKNAADHEKRSFEALMGPVELVYSEVFFREALNREFDRAWRHRTAFSVMLIGWRGNAEQGSGPEECDVMTLLRRNIRSSDIVAEADGPSLWVLAPETNEPGARCLAERLIEEALKAFGDKLTLFCGVAEFSRLAATPSDITARARLALTAAEFGDTRVVTLPVAAGSSTRPSPAL
jgi:uncharacterized protein YigA (DUF484 family)